jgi:hypothetical protein
MHFLACAGAIASVFSLGLIVFTYDEMKKMFEIAKITKRMKQLGVLSVVFLTLTIFIPSEQTMTQMMIANVLTTENIKSGTDFTQDQIGKLVDKISDAAIKVKEADGRR